TCGAGVCDIASCAAGYGDCDEDPANGCETPLDSLTDCGACGTSCDLDHATASCATGTCAISACSLGRGDCDGDPDTGCETPLVTLSDCGACGTPCSFANGTASCASGSCELLACDAGYADCDGNP